MTYVPSINRASTAMPPTDSPEYRKTPGHYRWLVADHARLPIRQSPLVVSSEIRPGELN